MMNRRKAIFYGAAFVVAASGVVTSQWIMTHLTPSTVLAVAFPAVLLFSGLIAGALTYFADPKDPSLPSASNDHGPERRKTRTRVRSADRET